MSSSHPILAAVTQEIQKKGFTRLDDRFEGVIVNAFEEAVNAEQFVVLVQEGFEGTPAEGAVERTNMGLGLASAYNLAVSQFTN